MENIIVEENRKRIKVSLRGEMDPEKTDAFEQLIKRKLVSAKPIEINLKEISLFESKVGRIINIVNSFSEAINKITMRRETLDYIKKYIDDIIKPKVITSQIDLVDLSRSSPERKEVYEPDKELRQQNSLKSDFYSEEYDCEVLKVYDDYVRVKFYDRLRNIFELNFHREIFAREEADFERAKVKYIIFHAKDQSFRKILLLNKDLSIEQKLEPISFRETKETFLRNVQKKKK
ncbi:MAG: hypothetical protein WA126_15690 [Thermodesulfovibrionales bacterium]